MSHKTGAILTEHLSSEFSKEFEKVSLSLPVSLSFDYKILSCLKYSDQTAAYLLYQKSSRQKVLLKTACDPIFTEALTNENYILNLINRQCKPDTAVFPVALKLGELNGTYYFIRSYIQGHTLEELCESNYKKTGLPEGQALLYITQVVKLLHFLHSLTPPVIHRDVKPQNVVVDAGGICHLIDLGISCHIPKRKRSDTPVMGTQATAPPEFFYKQTADVRSDLYSVGILLHYCVTGEYDISPDSLCEFSPNVPNFSKIFFFVRHFTKAHTSPSEICVRRIAENRSRMALRAAIFAREAL